MRDFAATAVSGGLVIVDIGDMGSAVWQPGMREAAIPPAPSVLREAGPPLTCERDADKNKQECGQTEKRGATRSRLIAGGIFRITQVSMPSQGV